MKKEHVMPLVSVLIQWLLRMAAKSLMQRLAEVFARKLMLIIVAIEQRPQRLMVVRRLGVIVQASARQHIPIIAITEWR